MKFASLRSLAICAILLGGTSASADTALFRYDALGRLTKACQSTNSVEQKIYYNYDAAGNRTNYTSVPIVFALSSGASTPTQDGRFTLIMQTNGDLVLSAPGNVGLWHTNTSGYSGNYAIFQTDGNLVVYRSNGIPVWASNTGGNPCAHIQFQNDGNLVIVSLDDTALWASNTGGH